MQHPAPSPPYLSQQQQQQQQAQLAPAHSWPVNSATDLQHRRSDGGVSYQQQGPGAVHPPPWGLGTTMGPGSAHGPGNLTTHGSAPMPYAPAPSPGACQPVLVKHLQPASFKQ
jgi:hypothetical protein